MVFVLAYTPCVAALAEQRRLFGWRPTASALVAQLATAWALAVMVFQVGSRLWGPCCECVDGGARRRCDARGNPGAGRTPARAAGVPPRVATSSSTAVHALTAGTS